MSPAATDAAGDNREFGGCAGDDVVLVDLHRGEVASEPDGQTVEASIGDQQIRTEADHEHRDLEFVDGRTQAGERGVALHVDEPASRSAHAVGGERADRDVSLQVVSEETGQAVVDVRGEHLSHLRRGRRSRARERRSGHRHPT